MAGEVHAGRFRGDLYSKLSVIPLHVPPLRERREDVPLLVEHFLDKYAREYGRARKTVEPGAMEALTLYSWPGNVRELRNLVERLVILAPVDAISIDDLPPPTVARPAPVLELPKQSATLREGRDAFEERMIRLRLEESGWNITRAAALLGIERSSLHRKMRARGIKPGSPADGSPAAS